MPESNDHRRNDRAQPDSFHRSRFLDENAIKLILKEEVERFSKVRAILRQKRNEDIKERARPNASYGLRLLKDNDIELVLDTVEKKFCKADVSLKQKLKDDINELLTLIIGVREVLCARLMPYEEIDAFSKVQTRVYELRTAMKDCGISLVEAADISAAGEHGQQLLGPRDIAYEMVDGALHVVSEIHSWAESGKKRALDRKGKQPNHHRTTRYVLIVGLSTIFARTFNLSPSATRGGPWCLFLKEVLSLSEDEECTEDAAHEAWLSTRRWQQARFRDYP